jgi:hypothetical protein
MPGANVLWNENSPAETDIADAAPIRSIVTSVRVGLAAEHAWPTSTGPGFGIHLLGSCRPFYDVQSNVSSSGTDGRTLVTSDTSRMFHVGSAGTMFIGGQNVISAGSQPQGGQRFYWAQEFGVTGQLNGNTLNTITFPNSGFSGIPFVVASCLTTLDVTHLVTGAFVTITRISATGFDVALTAGNGNFANNVQVCWMSLGTRTF